VRSAEDRELSQWLRRRMGGCRYWFWTVAGKILPPGALGWLIDRVYDEPERMDSEP
jgi:hypothetical protein